MQTVSDSKVGSLDPHGEAGEVNPHYLEHLLAASSKYDVRAGGDVVGQSGVKLLTAGTRLTDSVRDLLLENRPARPLENSITIADGVNAAQLQGTAMALLDEHPLMLALDASDAEESLLDVIGKLRLSPPLQALLTVYSLQKEDRLRHAVGVSLLTLAMARKLLPGKAMLHRQLALAGLMHDVGELYIEPIFQDRGRELEAIVFRQIASHPVIGYRVLAAMEGAGPVVADAVMAHHERMDGFGYPRGLADAQFAMPLQILAKAEWLMGLIEAGTGPLMRASISAKLIPGEFSQPVSLLVYMATRSSKEMAEFLETQTVTEVVAQRAAVIVTLLQRFRGLQALVDGIMTKGTPELRAVLDRGVKRLNRVQASFTSAGLDAVSPEQLLDAIKAKTDAGERQEMLSMIGEFSWRMREIERTFLLRGSLMSSGESALMRTFVTQLKGDLA